MKKGGYSPQEDIAIIRFYDEHHHGDLPILCTQLQRSYSSVNMRIQRLRAYGRLNKYINSKPKQQR